MRLKKTETLTTTKLNPYRVIAVKLPNRVIAFWRSPENKNKWCMKTSENILSGNHPFKYGTAEVVLKTNTYNLVPGVEVTLRK